MAARRVEQGEGEYRRRLLAGLSGQVIEVGAGSGLNFRFYPREVEHVLAVEPEPVLRNEAVTAAAEATVQVTVVSGIAGALPAGDETFAAGVASLVLCTVPNQARALAELLRVIRPGGELRFYEHVVADHRLPAALQRVADVTVWPHVAGGCHMARDTAGAIERAGFEMRTCERFTFSPGPAVPPIPHILGAAVRP